MRFIFDTNVLIDGFTDDYNPQARLIQAVLDEQLTAIYTPQVKREYDRILRRLIRDDQYRDKITDFLTRAERVSSASADELHHMGLSADQVVIDDQEDFKFIAGAIGGDADSIVTHDRHLLDIGEVGSISIIRPPEAWIRFSEDENGAGQWQQWAQDLGLTS